MATIVNSTVIPKNSTNFYHFLFTEIADPRTNSWFLIKDPGPGLAILIIWMYFVLNIGPKMMKDREPFDLRKTLIVYNLVQVIISSYIFIRGGIIGWFGKYSYKCQPIDYSDAPEAQEMRHLMYLYFINKLLELLDTVFFVLRKKQNQVTFLHMYHHTVMPMVSWGGIKYVPGGHGTLIGFINCFVHIIMYSYYSLAAFGPKIQKYLWWKKYITAMQLGQFCIVFIHNSQLFFRDCGYPTWTAFITAPNAVFFYFLFSHFYNQAYGSRKQSKKSDKNAKKIETNNNVSQKEIKAD
ncbi:elongation of very long chain fatty acids protein isoform X2 [Diabrotica virgifera virgifera]|nr:elongation of very long chain fatty acids protein isoform X2 [Diabrotica virgifera virgifera]XP_050502032.1 elongation of very long chain fatty acids protein isoform X2 [Diabrotica virgifera virgifera]XP_050502033.1 elongation of very long chain fatty acids protein isoform X2 [Diabrotica virgifera virgifera]XP_050502034.1 elongation of very long chain fatty acids protein isoform X2 [Diabrotica virgifera virgifera]